MHDFYVISFLDQFYNTCKIGYSSEQPLRYSSANESDDYMTVRLSYYDMYDVCIK